MGCQKLTYSDYFTPNLRVLKGGASRLKNQCSFNYQWDLIHDPQNILFAWGVDESEGAFVEVFGDPTENRSVVEDVLTLIRKQSQKSISEEYNIYADLSEKPDYEYYGNIELISGYKSNIMVVIGNDAFEEEVIKIKTGDLVEVDEISVHSELYDHKFSYIDLYKNKYNIDIYCKEIDKELVKKYLLGESIDIKDLLLEYYAFDETNEGTTSNTITDNNRVVYYLYSIIQANVNSSSSIEIADKWISQYTTYLKGTNILMDNGVSCDITITNPLKNELSPIKPLFNACSFGIDSDGRYANFRFPEQGTNNFISISCDEKYAQDLGRYLFGTKWQQTHSDEDRNWVLYIKDPSISEQFRVAVENNKILEQRRLTYKALSSQYNGEYAAILEKNKFESEDGVTVYTYISEGNELNNKPIQVSPLEGKKKDANYPVDIKLFVENGKPSTGELFYVDNSKPIDFKGWMIESSVAVTDYIKGVGIIQGYIKGYGYSEYEFTNEEGIGWEFEIEGSSITGKIIDDLEPTPKNFEGYGFSESIGAGIFSFGNWVGYQTDKNSDEIWTGNSVGISFSFLLDFGGSEIYTVTKLKYPTE